jgi:hypothetical protein
MVQGNYAYKFNDHHVSRGHISGQLISGNCYLIVYERIINN